MFKIGPSSVSEQAFADPKSRLAGSSTGQHPHSAFEHLASHMRRPAAALPGESFPPGIAPYPLKHNDSATRIVLEDTTLALQTSRFIAATLRNGSKRGWSFRSFPRAAPWKSRVPTSKMAKMQARFESLLRKFQKSMPKGPTGQPRDALDSQISCQRGRRCQCAGCPRRSLRCAPPWCSFSSFLTSRPAPQRRLPPASPAALPPPWGGPAQADNVYAYRVA